MKKHYLLSAIIIIMASLIFPYYAKTQHNIDKATLHIIVKNIKHDQGAIFIAVYNKKEFYMKEHFYEGRVEVHSKEDIDVKFKLPPGQYAISIFHDVNSDEELNTNFLGIPKEPYGFSNNSKSRFGPPDFEASTFEIKKEGYNMDIILK